MNPHYREAAAAEAAIADFYGTRYRPQPGDRVQCPRAFGDGYQPGVIACPEGDAYLVDTAEGRLLMYLEELEPVVEPCRPVEPLTTLAQPGSHNAAAARRAGCEDAYDNAMNARYGEAAFQERKRQTRKDIGTWFRFAKPAARQQNCGSCCPARAAAARPGGR